MTPPIKCTGCQNNLKIKECINCVQCFQAYCLACASMDPGMFSTMSLLKKKKWICPECCIKKPRSDNTNTPLRSATLPRAEYSVDNDTDIDYVTTRKTRTRIPDNECEKETSPAPETHQTNRQSSKYVNCRCGDLPSAVAREVRAALRSELPVILNEMLEIKLKPIKEQLIELQASATYISDEYDELKKNVSILTTNNKELQTESDGLRATINSLTDRLNQLEQVMRESNIEIQGVPEHKAENTISIINQLANVVNCKLADADILSCTRVASMNKQSKRPRTIVAKLRSNRCRDELYSAVVRYNKANPKDRLNSSLLGIAGDKSNVYVSEHLSPANKALHAAARILAKEKNYMFVWVRNGRIFMRKNETSRFIHIRNEKILSELE